MASPKEIATCAAAGQSIVLEGVGTHVMVTNLDGAGYAAFSCQAAPGAVTGEGLVGLAKAAGSRCFIPASRGTAKTVTVYGKASADTVVAYELVTLT